LCGLFSVYYTRTYLKAEKIITAVQNPWLRAALGGFMLGALILFFPPLFGEGYSSIRSLGEAHPESIFASSVLVQYIREPIVIVAFLLAVLMVKVWATALTICSGGHGGSFAPAVFTGGLLGFTFVYILNQFQITQTPAANFTLVGMCGVLTGIFHAPLTGIFLIAEITGGYELIIPLMIVAVVSLSVVRYFQPKSLDALKLQQKGHEHTHDQDITILNTLPVKSLIETDFAIVYSHETLGDLVKKISESKRNIFPVLDKEHRFMGVIQLDDVRSKIFEREWYDRVTVSELMQAAPDVIEHDEKMVSVMDKFDRTKAWNLPVVQKGKYLGFISKSKNFTEYRKHLQEHSLDF
jgi:chloride channel protein, CIC family